MDIGKPERVKEIREAPVPYKGDPVPTKRPERVPERVPVKVES